MIHTRTPSVSYLYATISVCLFGFMIFGCGLFKAAGFSLIELILVPSLIASLITLPFIYKNIYKYFKLPLWVQIFYPVVCVLAMFGQYAPLFMGVSVSLTLFLLSTQPFWTILISVLFLKSKFTLSEAGATFLVLLGLATLLTPWQDFSYSVGGITMALLGAACLSAWILFSTHFARIGIRSTTQTFFTSICNVIPLIILFPILTRQISDPAIVSLSLDHPLWLIGVLILYSYGVFVLAYLLFFKAAKTLSGIRLGLLLLLEPVIGTTLDVLFLDTTLTWNLVIGGSIILLANVWLVLKTTYQQYKW